MRSLQDDGGKEKRLPSAAPQARPSHWLEENGPKELEQLFRTIVYHPAATILIADNDRNFREASGGAGKFFGLPREKIVGRSLEDFASPSMKPTIPERCRR